jgi:hypothetical protein
LRLRYSIFRGESLTWISSVVGAGVCGPTRRSP